MAKMMKKKMVTTRKEVRTDRHPQEKAYLENILNNFQKHIVNGFSDENWENALQCYTWLSLQLFQGEREVLADAWRLAYVNADVSAVISCIDHVRAKL